MFLRVVDAVVLSLAVSSQFCVASEVNCDDMRGLWGNSSHSTLNIESIDQETGAITGSY